MPSNVEIKARLRDPEATLAAARSLSSAAPVVIEQHDTFYECATGRLKLRRFPDGKGELIAYERPDTDGPKTSQYLIYRTDDAAGLAATLAAAMLPLGVVRKTRRLLLVGRTRIHLDNVQDLGHFLELEVVLAEGDDPDEGAAEARTLLQRLRIQDTDLVSGAYIDHLREIS